MSRVLDASVSIATLSPAEPHHIAALSAALLDEAVRLARLTGLRAYDAVYVAVAARHRTPLVTLDRDVVRRIEAAGVGVEVWA